MISSTTKHANQLAQTAFAMTDRPSAEIWALSITSSGIGVTAMSLDAHYRAYFEPWASTDPIALTTAQTFYNTLNTLFEQLGQNADPPLAICLSACTTAGFVDKYGQLMSPIYLETPTPMPRRDVPECFADDPTLFAVYRNSLMRRLQNVSPTTWPDDIGLSTAAGCLIRALTGAHLDAMVPLGTPDAYPWAYHELREMYFRALGVNAQNSVSRTRAGYAVAMVSEVEPLPRDAAILEAWRHKLVGIPIFHTGTATAAAAYACAADPLSWSCVFGWQTSAHWTASHSACAAYEISIQDAKTDTDIKNSTPDDDTHALTRDEWTRYLSNILPLEAEYGARRNDLAYGMTSPSYRTYPLRLAEQQTRELFTQLSQTPPRFAEDLLTLAPLGSAGLHIWPANDAIQIAGIQPAHTPAHFFRATFESQAYAIRAWREMTHLDGLGPIRAAFEPPWDISCAQILSDILETTVITPDVNYATLAAIGTAIALMRDLNITTPDAKPHLDAYEIHPSQSANYYRAHAQIHALLSKG